MADNMMTDKDYMERAIKLAAMGITIDVLTPEQEAYLSGWTAE